MGNVLSNCLNVQLMQSELGVLCGTPVILVISVKSRTDNLNSPVFSFNLVLIAKALQNIINVIYPFLKAN